MRQKLRGAEKRDPSTENGLAGCTAAASPGIEGPPEPGSALRLDETIVKSGGESVEAPLSCVSPAASQLSQSYEFRAAVVNAHPP